MATMCETELVGRAEELAELARVLRTAASGTPSIALLEGEAGIGKSRLLAELVRVAVALGFEVRSTKIDELERDRPFGGIADAIGLHPASPDPHLAELARAVLGDHSQRSTAKGGSPQQVRFRLIEAIVEHVRQASRARPLLLALDDLHWADPSTLLTLNRLIRQAGTPLAVIGTLRLIPRGPELDLLLRSVTEEGTTVRLQALTGDDVAQLASDMLGLGPGPRLRHQLERAAGNPFFVRELIAALEEEHLIQRAGDVAEVSGLAVPPTLRVTILRRLGYLSAPTLKALRMAAVLGTSFAVDDLALTMGRPIGEVSDVLEEALAARVVADAPPRLAFRHDLVREAIYEDMAHGMRAGLHLQAARALMAADRPAESVAVHLALGAPPGDREAVRWLRRAAVETLPKAPAVAVTFLERAAEIAGPGDPDRDEIQAELVHALLWSSKLGRAESLAQEVLARPHDPALRASLRNGLARALVWQGRPADSLAQIDQALAEHPNEDSDHAYLLAEAALRLVHCRDLQGSEAAADQAIDLARRTRHAIAECDAMCARTLTGALSGRIPQAIEFADRAMALADAIPEARVVIPGHYRATALIAADRLDEAETTLARAAQVVGELGSPSHQPIIEAHLALTAFLRGDWSRAEQQARDSLASSDEVGMRAFRSWGHALRGLTAIHSGRLEEADQVIAAGLAEVRSDNPSRFGLSWLLLAKAELEEAQGRPVDARLLLAGTWELFTHLDCLWECQALAPRLVRLCASEGELASRVCGSMDELARRAGTGSAWATTRACRGIAAGDAELIAAGAEAFDRIGLPFDAAMAWEQAGRASSGPEAAPHLARAAERFEAVGATRDLARVQAHMREHGLRRGARGSRGRPSTGWAALTRTESEVAGLVAEGLTNPQIAARLFVSRKTVETHVSHILGKLGISSRVQLAAEMAGRRLGSAPDRLPRESVT